MPVKPQKVRTPLFPRYSWVRALLPILENVSKAEVTHMIQCIWDQTGTPQNPVDWSDPDSWIVERLNGRDAGLALHIWNDSNHLVNPRHIYGSYLFINTYELLSPDQNGIYKISTRGRAFHADDPVVIRELDEEEGLLRILGILASKTTARRGDFLEEWSEYLLEYSNFSTPGTFKDTLGRRLANLVERGLVKREGNAYEITEEGLKYAEKGISAEEDKRAHAMRALKQYNVSQREELRSALGNMPPYQFEHLIRDLLESMGYEDVFVTKEAGDKGVDVVATVQFGITTIKEVVQVKRHQSSLGRPILDQLRGALPYHQAIRGTLITLGTISKGCREAALFPGAAPITLIDGEKLLDLLIEHEVGMKKRPAVLWEVDQSYFSEGKSASVE